MSLDNSSSEDAQYLQTDKVSGEKYIFNSSRTDRGGSNAPNMLEENVPESSLKFKVYNYIVLNGSGAAGGSSRYFTISFIMKKHNVTNTSRVGVLAGNGWYLQTYYDSLIVTDSPSLSSTLTDADNMAIAPVCLGDGTPHHVALVFGVNDSNGASAVRVYVDGIKKADSYENQILTTTSIREYLTYIGGTSSSATFGRDDNPGWMQQFHKWDRELTAHEVANLAYFAKFSLPAVTLSGTIVDGYIANEFRVRMHRADTGELIHQEVTDTGSFSAEVPDHEYYVIVSAEQGEPWRPGIAYGVGDKVYPSNPNATRFYFECTVAGTTGATEPVWNINQYDTTLDNDIIWTIVEALIQPITHAPVRGA